MSKSLRSQAKKKVEAKVAFVTCAIIFSFTSVILMMISFYLPSVGFWLRLPIPVMIMVLAILYLSAYGLPFSGAFSAEWQEEETEREMIRLYRKRLNESKREKILASTEKLELDELELKELERLEEKWSDEDLV